MKKKALSWLIICALVLSLGTVCALAQEEEEQAPALSDDIYSFQLMLDGELYTFPMSYEDFTAMGWEYQGDENEQLSPNQYTVAETFAKDGLEIYVTLANLGINTASYAQCAVGGISIDPYQFKEAPDTQLTLPGGIVYGVSTAEDIQAAYGTATDSYEGDMYTKLTYEHDYYQDWDLSVYKESGVLEEVEVRNLVADEQANAEAAAQVSDEPTQEVLAYAAPEELGDDPLSFRVEFAGDLYQLPAPVSVFLENGWTLKKELSATIVSGRDFGWVELMKDNQELRCIARNYSPDAAVVENCFITSVEADTYGTDLPLTGPGGATVGMTEQELTAWLDGLDGVEYEQEQSGSFAYYTIEGPESSLDGIEFVVNQEEDAVTSIEVSYEPDSLS